MSQHTYTAEQMEDARAELSRAAMMSVAFLDLPIVGVDIPDADCVRRLLERAAGVDLDIQSYLN